MKENEYCEFMKTGDSHTLISYGEKPMYVCIKTYNNVIM